ncbi:response regulator transcription factor [Paenibacillus sp. MMS20-IR301]|uniref:response regulator transcription factor n=1 Tax=Paenibacillus sp. MMS20-IR301 TaxID=2895946 RepID=UPI0028E5720B|nr:response regulator transcription factor [Paenibacillus sp. MMS20-IR301]WNS41177.1 response regulator transcription factor [Paenibacillus sp. MMS20-IR301]
MDNISVLHIDEDILWRDKIKQYIRGQSNITLTASVSSEQEAIIHMQQSKVDVIVMEVLLNDSPNNGFDIITKLSEIQQVDIIVLSSVNDLEIITDIFCAGAVNFLMKHNFEDIAIAIRDVHLKRVSIHPDATPIICGEFRRLRTQMFDQLLTPVERQVITYLYQGNSKPQISKIMNVGFETTKTHVKHILSKLQVGNCKEAVKLAERRGLFKENAKIP